MQNNGKRIKNGSNIISLKHKNILTVGQASIKSETSIC